MKNERVKIFFVDDDAFYLKLLEIEFRAQTDFDMEFFATGEECLQNIHSNPDVVVLDYHLDGVVPTAMNGIETLDRIKLYNAQIPVIMLSSQDRIEVAVECMHHKAFDYVVKSETAFFRLRKIIKVISKLNSLEKELTWYMSRM